MTRSVSPSGSSIVWTVANREMVVAASWRVSGINRITGQIDKMGIERARACCALLG